ncbi:HEPN domain-containing protein [candidate division KSB1 bacterium]|nr:HEPN domain-containing protein [candidate division KSB1 bacterium]
MLVYLDLTFEKIHSISKLLKQIEGAGIMVPDEIKETSELTVYAVDTRYPGDYDPITEEEYQLVLSMAERAVKWAEEKISELKQTEAENDNT